MSRPVVVWEWMFITLLGAGVLFHANSENDVARIEKEIDKYMGEYQAKIDEVFKAKEKEVMTV